MHVGVSNQPEKHARGHNGQKILKNYHFPTSHSNVSADSGANPKPAHDVGATVSISDEDTLLGKLGRVRVSSLSGGRQGG